NDALAHGAKPPLRFLWDLGAWELIADREARPGDPTELQLVADAATMAGSYAMAVNLYLELITLYPDYSYKPYAALARLARNTDEFDDAYAIPFSPAWTRSDDSAESGSQPGFIGELARRFSTNTDACVERAWYYVSNGQPELAEPVLASLPSESDAALAIRLAWENLQSPDHVLPSALRLASARPDSSLALEAALSCMFLRSAWKEFRSLFASVGTELPRAWFWSAVDNALAGDTTGAITAIRDGGSAFAGRAASYNLGMLELAAGQAAQAASSFVTAVAEPDYPSYSVSRGPSLARCWEMAGFAWYQVGHMDEARAAYRSALSLDQNSLAARSGLELLP
ncbi:MAG TPA: hypothetical protein PLC54_03560, partial [Spirochaetales bacterium]|nr:hypothetical protein [Spirochaetales bacterium]